MGTDSTRPDTTGPDTTGPDTTGPDTPGTDSAAAASALTGDDPIAAVSVLLALRAECFSTESVLCLDAVDHEGSAILEADQWAIRRAQQGEGDGVPIAIAGATLVERVGAAAILEASMVPPPDAPDAAEGDPDASAVPATPVTILLIRAEEGWRLRDLIPG